MGRRILFIAYDYPPVGGLSLPGAQRMTKLIRNLEYEQAHVLTVLPNHYPNYVDLNNKLDLPIKNESIHRTRTINIFNIIIALRNLIFRKQKKPDVNHIPNNQTHNNTQTYKSSPIWYEQTSRSKLQELKDFLFRLFHYPDDAAPWIIPAIFHGLRIIRKYGITIIFATGRPWSSMYIGWLLSKTTRVPLVVDFRDPWIGNIFHVSMGTFFDKTSIKLERKIVKHAKLIFVNTEELRSSFIERYPDLDFSKFQTLPNGYDINDYKEVLESYNDQHSLTDPNKLVIVHAGFLYGTRDPSPIIDAIKKLSDIHSEGNIIFCQIGKIDLDYNLYEKYKNELVSEKIVLIDQLPFEECLRRMANADVLLNIQPKTTTQVPSKLYDYLCLNKPIITIAPLDGALGNLILSYGFGYIFCPENINGIILCLRKLVQDKRENKGKLIANYSQRSLFDIQRIAKQISASLDKAGV